MVSVQLNYTHGPNYPQWNGMIRFSTNTDECVVCVFCWIVVKSKSFKGYWLCLVWRKKHIFHYCRKELLLKVAVFRKRAVLSGVTFCAEEDVPVVWNEARWRVKRRKVLRARLYVCFWVVSRDIVTCLFPYVTQVRSAATSRPGGDYCIM